MNEVLQRIADVGVIPVVTVDNPNHALPLGTALLEGDLPVAEVTFRTNAAEESIRVLASELPDLLVGAGTVLTVEQAQKAVSAGAKFITSAGFNPDLVGYCMDNGILVVPGANTPTQVEQGLRAGLSLMRFFPAEQSGGPAMLRALSAPYHAMHYIPSGGVNAANLQGYLALPCVLAAAGSWMAPPDLIAAERFDDVARLSRQAVIQAVGFELDHVGINEPDAGTAQDESELMCDLFGFPLRQGNKSFFVGDGFEFMKTPFLGMHGHIALSVLSMTRALAFLARKGMGTRSETERHDERGRLTFVYLDREIGGFAIHLMQR